MTRARKRRRKRKKGISSLLRRELRGSGQMVGMTRTTMTTMTTNGASGYLGALSDLSACQLDGARMVIDQARGQ